MKNVFVSYSRQQLYLAEDLVLRLKERGLNVWFDLDRLYPGVEWESKINEGLANSDTLILIASHASLASSNVNYELQSALKLGRTILVLLYEAADLPESLRAAPMFDARQDFYSGTRKLVDYITGKPDSTDPSISPNRWGITWRIPSTIRWIALALLMPGVVSLQFTFLSLQPSLIWIPSFLGSLFSCYLTVRFLRHRMRYRELRLYFQIIVAIAVPFLLLGLCSLSTIILSFSSTNTLSLVLNLLMLALAGGVVYLYFRVMRYSEELLYWLPRDPDEGVQKMRTHLREWRAGLIQVDDQVAQHLVAKSYVLYAAPGDEIHALHLAGLLGLKNRKVFPATVHEGAVCIAVISSRTPQQDIQKLYEGYKSNLIGILISPIGESAPDQENAALDYVQRYQYVDFRDGDSRRLQAIRNMLEGKGISIQYAINTIPLGEGLLELPVPLTGLVWLLRLWGAAVIGLGVAGVLGIQNESLTSLIPTHNITAVSLCIIGLIHFYVVDLLIHRRLNSQWLLLLTLGLNMFCVIVISSKNIVMGLVIFGMLTYTILSWVRPYVQRWLPSTTQLIDSTTTMVLDRRRQVWMLNLVALILVFSALIADVDFSSATLVPLVILAGWVWFVNLALSGKLKRPSPKSR